MYKREFPDYDGKLIIPKGFMDTSYHNDVCPKVSRYLESDSTITEINIFQDYVDIDKREIESARFTFQIMVNSELIMHYNTDDWAEIEKLISMISF